ncbi:WD40 repeat-like protein [Mycena olivaceomarginata]|nr:WD40 repeat-like protein [Mycena olivaceomarginata]
MNNFPDEGFTDDDAFHAPTSNELLSRMTSEQECEELAYKLLASLPRSRLATIQRRLAPLLQFDVVGSLPAEVSLQIFSHLPAQTLLTCALPRGRLGTTTRGMGDSDEEEEEDADNIETAKAEWTLMQAELNSGFGSMSLTSPSPRASVLQDPSSRSKSRTRHNSAPPVLSDSTFLRPDYKRLHQTHTRLQNRTRGGPSNAHTTTIYCLQLYTYPATGVQVLFTGSRDRTVREWNLTTGLVERVISGVHASSVLSICVHDGFVASAGSDPARRGVGPREERARQDHRGPRGQRAVACASTGGGSCPFSKDRTVRTYSFPDLTPQFCARRAPRGGQRRVALRHAHRFWLRVTAPCACGTRPPASSSATFENHHTRGSPPSTSWRLTSSSGSSDKHLRLFDITTFQGWSTSPEYDVGSPPAAPLAPGSVDGAGPHGQRAAARRCAVHSDLVRSVALGPDFVLSGSYDLTIKVWDRKTGALVADLTGGHSGRIFCIGFDCTKIVSCGEDQRICVWDFSHGIDTSFIQL